MSEVSKEDFDAWRDQDVTKAVFKQVESLRMDIVHSWLEGVYAYSEYDAHMALGRAKGLGELLEVDYIDV